MSAAVRGKYRIASGFGYRKDPYGRGTRLNGGIDIASDTPGKKVPLYAIRSGFVRTGFIPGDAGNYVWIGNSSDGYRYCHLDSFNARFGQWVEAGDELGVMGMTGSAQGVHVHLERWLALKRVDFADILSTLDSKPAPAPSKPQPQTTPLEVGKLASMLANDGVHDYVYTALGYAPIKTTEHARALLKVRDGQLVGKVP
ncbi:M23 family metallopeptidase [Humidisolicoccus flavus]|uniref:M23 family metallopeptidase n=1 Tax=Humidisolicoccus flavus TaxID=3111414 RepID=UPI00324A5E07